MDARSPVALIASLGRAVMLLAAPVSLVSLFSSQAFQRYSTVDIVALLGTLTLGALAVASLLEARRALDVAMVFVAGTLAGFLFYVATENFLGLSLMPLFAWLLLAGACAAVGCGLSTGAVEVDPRGRAIVGDALTRMRTSTPVTIPTGAGTPVAVAAQPVVPGAPVPGWYEDGTQLRWWDGSDWTDHVRTRT